MSDEFIVSARKYRPAIFSTVVGQGHITTTLQSAVVRGQIAHAYLFTGPRGVGKTTCARIFAKAVNCTDRSANGDPCGECESCRAFNENRSWAIHEMDAASNNSVENIRELTERVQTPPQGSKYSVYIIDEVHMLSTAAFNAFLKTLEEPPSYAIFILATTEKHKILPTILSRCQCYDFRRITISDMVSFLRDIAVKENVDADDESLNLIAQKADGAMRDALSIFDRVVSYTSGHLTVQNTSEATGSLDYDTYFKTVSLALSEDYHGLLLLFADVLAKGFDGGQYLGGLAEHIRNLLVAKSPQTASLLDISGSLRQRYVDQASPLEQAYLLNCLQLISSADSGYRTAVNQRLHVELALMKLGGLKKKDSSPYGIVWEVTPDLPSSRMLREKTFPGEGGSEVKTSPVSSPVPADGSAVQNPSSRGAGVQGRPVSVTGDAEPSVTRKMVKSVSSMPDFSLTGDIRPRKVQSETAAVHENTCLGLADPDMIRSRWNEFLAMLGKRGMQRQAAALSHALIDGAGVHVEVANETIRDEIMVMKMNLQDMIAEMTNVRVEISVTVSESEVFIAKPVSDSQRLAIMMEKSPSVRKLCQSLKLGL